tara:strand:+ start:223 stop:798 length:576 start_codon:yes stop_codon:yes gene_type:complete
VVDELAGPFDNPSVLLNRFYRDERGRGLDGLLHLPTDSLSESSKVENYFFLSSGDHGGALFSSDRLIVSGVPGARVTGRWFFESSFALVTGVHFVAGRGSDPLADVRSGARVLFRNCVFQMSPAESSVAVNVASGGKAMFDGCAFLPALGGGTGHPINCGAIPNPPVVLSGVNITGRAHAAAVVIAVPEMT